VLEALNLRRRIADSNRVRSTFTKQPYIRQSSTNTHNYAPLSPRSRKCEETKKRDAPFCIGDYYP